MKTIKDILLSIRPEEDFERSHNFIEDGLLDSFDVVTLVSELDKTFALSIEGIDIVPENFSNIASIARLVRKYGVAV